MNTNESIKKEIEEDIIINKWVILIVLFLIGVFGYGILLDGIYDKIWYWNIYKTIIVIIGILLILIGTWKFTEKNKNGI